MFHTLAFRRHDIKELFSFLKLMFSCFLIVCLHFWWSIRFCFCASTLTVSNFPSSIKNCQMAKYLYLFDFDVLNSQIAFRDSIYARKHTLWLVTTELLSFMNMSYSLEYDWINFMMKKFQLLLLFKLLLWLEFRMGYTLSTKHITNV